MNIIRNIKRHLGWFDYIIIAVNMLTVIANIAMGEYMLAMWIASATFFYGGYIWFMNAYFEAKNEIRTLRTNLLTK